MVTLKVVSYYDAWLGENKRAVLMEKDGVLYDASGLFSKLGKFELDNMLNIDVLHEENINYCDSDAEEQKEFLLEIQRLEKMYGVKQFGGIKSKIHWIYVNGISHIKAYQ